MEGVICSSVCSLGNHPHDTLDNYQHLATTQYPHDEVLLSGISLLALAFVGQFTPIWRPGRRTDTPTFVMYLVPTHVAVSAQCKLEGLCGVLLSKRW